MFNRASRRAAAKAPPVPVEPARKPLSEAPQKLRELAGSVQALEQTHALLTAGLYPGQLAGYVQTSKAFIETLLSSQRAELEAQSEYSEYFPKAKQS